MASILRCSVRCEGQCQIPERLNLISQKPQTFLLRVLSYSLTAIAVTMKVLWFEVVLEGKHPPKTLPPGALSSAVIPGSVVIFCRVSLRFGMLIKAARASSRLAN